MSGTQGRTICLAALLLALVCTDPASAQGPYKLESAREWTLLGSGAALNIGGLALMSGIEPFTVEELGALDPSGINSFDRDGMRPYRATADGDAMLYASFLFPLGLLADGRSRDDWKTLGVMWGEVLLINSGVTALTKGLSQRTRPYAYDSQAPIDKRTSRDARVSFFSGHTATTAATCFFVATVVSDYPFSGTAKTVVWSAAAIYPAVTGFLRIDSGHHFRTDVITGYVVGAAIGVLIPKLHKSTPSEGVAPYQSVSPDGMKIGFVFRF